MREREGGREEEREREKEREREGEREREAGRQTDRQTDRDRDRGRGRGRDTDTETQTNGPRKTDRQTEMGERGRRTVCYKSLQIHMGRQHFQPAILLLAGRLTSPAASNKPNTIISHDSTNAIDDQPVPAHNRNTLPPAGQPLKLSFRCFVCLFSF